VSGLPRRYPYRTGLTFFDVNYGNILIDWTVENPVIRIQVCDEKGTVVLQQRNALQPFFIHVEVAISSEIAFCTNFVQPSE